MSENSGDRKEIPFWRLILLAILGALIVSAVSLFLFNQPSRKDVQPTDSHRSSGVMD
jgi:hypothetical protein